MDSKVDESVIPHSLNELQQDNSADRKRLRFGLTSLIVATNLIGFFLAMIVMTRGGVFGILIVIGFWLPAIVAMILAAIHFYEKATGKTIGAKRFLPKPKKKHPLE